MSAIEYGIPSKKYSTDFSVPNEKILIFLLGMLVLPSFIIMALILGGDRFVNNLQSLIPNLFSSSITFFILIYFILGLFIGLGLIVTLINLLATFPIIYKIKFKHDITSISWLRFLAIINLFNPFHGTILSIIILHIIPKSFTPEQDRINLDS